MLVQSHYSSTAHQNLPATVYWSLYALTPPLGFPGQSNSVCWAICLKFVTAGALGTHAGSKQASATAGCARSALHASGLWYLSAFDYSTLLKCLSGLQSDSKSEGLPSPMRISGLKQHYSCRNG